MAMIKCPECGQEVSSMAKNCPKCGCPIDTQVRCPKCGSTDVKLISGASKAASYAMFGIASVNKLRSTYKCNSCRFKF